MRTLRNSLLLIATLATASLNAQAPGTLSQSEVLRRYINAMGGQSGLANVNSIRIDATLTDPNGQNMDLLIIKKRPNMVRTVCDFTIGDGDRTMAVRSVQAYDGERAWWVQPGQTMKDASIMPESSARSLIRDAYFESPLVDPKEKNVKLEMEPEPRDLGGVYTCYVVSATHEDGTVSKYFLDNEKFLERRIELIRTIDGKKKVQASIPSDYRYFDGLPVAMRIVNLDGEGNRISQIQIDKVDINPGILDTYFKMPAAAQEQIDTAQTE